jgi:hypothetical protein
MAVASIRLDHCQIAVDEYYRTGQQPKHSPAATAYLSLDTVDWPDDDRTRLKGMSFVDLERQFDSLHARVRTAIVVQLSRYVVGCTFTEEAT